MRPRTLAPLVLAIVTLASVPCLHADPVIDWNVTSLEVAAAGGQTLPLPLSRTLAMVHLAIHDALNAIERRYEPYVHEARAEAGADPDAAVAAAARDVLAGIIPRYGNAAQRVKAT